MYNIFSTVGELMDMLRDLPRETPILVTDTNPEHRPQEYQQNAYISVEDMVKDTGVARDMFDGVDYQFNYYRYAKDNETGTPMVIIR